MPLLVQVGSGTLTTAGNTVVSGLGFLPGLIFFLGNNQTALGYNGNAVLTAGQSNGITMGTTSVHCNSGLTASNCAALFAGWNITGDTDSYEETQTTTAGTDFEFEQVALAATTFTMTALQNPASLLPFEYLAIGGSDLLRTNLSGFVANSNIGLQKIIGVGFQPDLLLLMWGAWKSGPALGSNNVYVIGWGAADGRNQWAVGTSGALQNSVAKTMQRTDRCWIDGNATGTIDSEASFVSFDPDGFTINILTSGTRTTFIGYVAVKGPACRVGSFNKSTAAAPVTDSINVGFPPLAAFFATHGTVSSTAVQADCTISCGYADGTRHSNTWFISKDGVATSSSLSRRLQNKAITIGTTPNVTQAEAGVTFTGTNVNVNWTTNSGTASEILFWTLGSAVGARPTTLIANQTVKRVKFW